MILRIDAIGPNRTRCRELKLNSNEALNLLTEYKDQLEHKCHPISMKLVETITLKVEFTDDTSVDSAISLLDSKTDISE